MRYYRVKPQYDNYKLSRDYEIFVGTELLTETEYKKALLKYANRNNTRRATIPPSSRDKAMFAKKFDIVEISKNKTYWFFGARFAREANINEKY